MARTINISSQEDKNDMIQFLRSNGTIFPSGFNKEQRKRFKIRAKPFILVDEHLCFKTSDNRIRRAVFDFETNIVEMILQQEHSSGHPGINKMEDLIKRKYYGISVASIREFVQRCNACRNFNSLRTVQNIQVNEIKEKYDRFIMDCVDLRRYRTQNSGFCWILNVIDTYSKYLFSFKLKNKSAEAIKEALESLFFTQGVPKSIQADNGREFSNQLLADFLLSLNVRMVHGRPRHPQSQGQVERVNQTIKRWLAKTLHPLNSVRWIDHLQKVVYL